MDQTTLTIIAAAVAVAAGVAAGLLFARWRAAGMDAAAARVEAERLGGELGATREQLEKAQAKARRATSELAEVRKKLEKSKKRTAQLHDEGRGRTGAPGGAGLAGEQALEEARQARDVARAELEAVSAELSRLRAEKAEAAEEDRRPAPAAVAGIEVEALQAQSAAAAEALVAEREALRRANAEVERLKKKAKSQETLYVSIRSELEVKKDRIRAQQEEIERLHALKVALVDPLPPREAIGDEDLGDEEIGDHDFGHHDAPDEIETTADERDHVEPAEQRLKLEGESNGESPVSPS